MNTRPTAALLALVMSAGALASGCSMNKSQKGAIIGAVAGAGAGAAIGANNGSTVRGALAGAIVGGAAGAIIGNQMDQQARELRQNIPGARVERVGEGIAVTFESGLLFDFDSDVVRAQAATNLRNLASSLGKYPNTDVLIVGHTDATGADTYNQALSERRANSAAAFIAREGVPRARVRAVGRGETEPIAENESDNGRAKNRRVEIAIVANEAARRQR
ncbi:MAG TPA: OmpA family protein [Gemmatimonadaceae bacterium]|nr:OmpA family protein [Gemmatimonadaceae bacterium]